MKKYSISVKYGRIMHNQTNLEYFEEYHEDSFYFYKLHSVILMTNFFLFFLIAVSSSFNSKLFHYKSEL